MTLPLTISFHSLHSKEILVIYIWDYFNTFLFGFKEIIPASLDTSTETVGVSCLRDLVKSFDFTESPLPPPMGRPSETLSSFFSSSSSALSSSALGASEVVEFLLSATAPPFLKNADKFSFPPTFPANTRLSASSRAKFVFSSDCVELSSF